VRGAATRVKVGKTTLYEALRAELARPQTRRLPTCPLKWPLVTEVLVQGHIAERIVDEADIQRLLALTTKPRDATLLRLAYVSGLRIAELSALRWRCFAPRESGAVLSVIGKGSRLRHIFLPEYIASAVATLRDDATDSAPIFLSRHHKPLSVNAMHTIVKQAARRAGLPPTFSMHWCRHAHASHAMDRGAPVHVVQQTLGHASLATTCRYVHCKPGASSAQFIAAC